ncbi:MAG TPA: Stk1 family PASTA domain-containing Ser/Thr kinase [Actinomycetota bacterium]|nr:Stk1 family PASTA domain-containing Ser/Thr kinase [Actinomycetota bacterium]
MSRTTTEHRILSNRYRVEDFLGQGGMARVHRGTDLVLDRTVAIKILAEHLTRDPQAVRRFRREAQAAAGLSHPGIVAVYDTGSDGTVHFIVMEYITGRTLADILDEGGALPSDRAIGIAGAVASALAHAHEKGIVHRDVKPGNIMLTPAGEVKVMDFGIARAVSSGTFTSTASVLGTATYFAPEQARGEPVDARTDLYALGVVLYEMLTGRPPFTADSPVAVAYKHVREEPLPPSRLNPGIGPALEAVVLMAMAKDRAARYQTAQELGRDLQRVEGSGVAATAPATSSARTTQPVPVQGTAVLPPVTSPGALPPTHRPRKRTRWASWLVALGTVVAVGLISALVLSGLSRRPVGGVGPSSPTTPSTQSPTPTPTLARQEPPSVQGALDHLGLVLTQGVNDGDLSRGSANKISGDIEDALEDYQHGDLEKALDRLDDVQRKVTELESKGDITPTLAGRLHEGISDLAAAMEASPPPPNDEGDE